MAPVATTIVEDLSRAGVRPDLITLRRVPDATLGTPEIVITIPVTAAARTVTLAGLRAVQRTPQRQPGDGVVKRVEIVLVGSAHREGHEDGFPISRCEIGTDALKGVLDDVVSAVNEA